jgi:mycofactocin precursor
MPDRASELLDRPADEIADARPDGGATGPDIADVEPGDVIAADLLVEEISIDGMCGVY